SDLVKVVVVSNTLVIGIDGTGSEAWLAKEVDKVRINERNTLDGTRWNSHVRNLVADSWPFAMTIYRHGPANQQTGSDSDDIFRAVRDDARNMITDAGGGTKVALVGWSRGAMIALSVANDLSKPTQGKDWAVEFVGLYDPVDMSASIGDDAAVIHDGIRRVVIVGPTLVQEEFYNVDYPVGLPSYWLGFVLEPDPVFVRMSRGRITGNGKTIVDYKVYNASHGGIGGCPGYNGHLVDAPKGSYRYDKDVEFSIASDTDIREGMRAAGLDFVPYRNRAWYGFPVTRPVTLK
ncbi:MAG: hypothetical protein ACK5SI_13930, partial [Planctomycetia bacterium]